MAASGSTPISLYYSTTPTQQPSAGNLVYGELALNIYDGKMYYKDNTNTIQLIASKASTAAAVVSVTGASPVTSSGGTTPAIGLASGYGDTQNPYASKTQNYVLAAPNGSSGLPTFRALDDTDIPTTLTNKTLTNPTVTNYVESVVAIGTVTTSNTISLTSGTIQTVTLSAGATCIFTMPTAVAGKSFIVLIKQAASTGSGNATFSGVKWAGSVTPTITPTPGKMDIATFVSDGTNWYGSISQGYTP